MATMTEVQTLLVIHEHQKISDFANANITTQSIAQNNYDNKHDHHIEGNITTVQNWDKVCESVISAPIIF